jgi:hypothetical protein
LGYIGFLLRLVVLMYHFLLTYISSCHPTLGPRGREVYPNRPTTTTITILISSEINLRMSERVSLNDNLLTPTNAILFLALPHRDLETLQELLPSHHILRTAIHLHGERKFLQEHGNGIYKASQPPEA